MPRIRSTPIRARRSSSRPTSGTPSTYQATARDEEVGLFNRFAVMRHWREAERIPFEQFLSTDLLHMNDWSYGCVAKLLATALLDGAKLPAATASTAPTTVK